MPSNEHQYIIDKINITALPHQSRRPLKDSDFALRTISSDVNGYRKHYGTNLEGMAISNNTIYLISDNKHGAAPCSVDGEGRTVLLYLADN
jgi:hypothetical protein